MSCGEMLSDHSIEQNDQLQCMHFDPLEEVTGGTIRIADAQLIIEGVGKPYLLSQNQVSERQRWDFVNVDVKIIATALSPDSYV